MSAKLTKKVFLQFPKQMLVSPHLYSHKPTIEEECSVVIAEQVTHIKKKSKESVPNVELEDTPMKEDSEDSKVEEESPEKVDEQSDQENENSTGCTIGFWYLDGLRSIVKTNSQRIY